MTAGRQDVFVFAVLVLLLSSVVALSMTNHNVPPVIEGSVPACIAWLLRGTVNGTAIGKKLNGTPKDTTGGTP